MPDMTQTSPLDTLTRWVEIDCQAAARNLLRFKKACPRVMAVVKADCYGHGRQLVWDFVEAGADWLATATLEEALALRSSGIRIPILVLGQIEAVRAEEIASARITVAVGSLSFARELNEAAETAHVTVDCHLKLDTGMGRIGFDATVPNVTEQILQAAALPGLRFTGAFQHFAVADQQSEQSDAFTALQFARFTGVLEVCERRGVHFPLKHCCNSAAAIRFPQYHLDMVRAGISLYGLPAGDAGLFGCQPVLSWRARITQVKQILPGQSVSYGRDFTARRPTDVATVALGYADGYRRLMANQGAALVHGQRVPVIGRICMDQLMLDVTGLDVKTGDVATFIGRDGDQVLTCTEMAKALDTIEYEVTCLIGPRCPRIFCDCADATNL